MSKKFLYLFNLVLIFFLLKFESYYTILFLIVNFRIFFFLFLSIRSKAHSWNHHIVFTLIKNRTREPRSFVLHEATSLPPFPQFDTIAKENN